MDIVTEKKCTKCGQAGEFRDKRNVCKACERASARRYRDANPEKSKATLKRYREANKEKRNMQSQKWHDANPEKAKDLDKRWRGANPQKRKAIDMRWRKKHPDKRNAYRHAYVARKRGGGGRYTAQEWKDLCERCGNKCLCCGKEKIKLTVDHVVPLIAGGKNVIENIQPLCRSCNSRKGIKTIDYRVMESD